METESTLHRQCHDSNDVDDDGTVVVAVADDDDESKQIRGTKTERDTKQTSFQAHMNTSGE